MAQAPVPSRVGTPAFACVAEAWTAHEAELRGFLRHQTGDADAAEDLLQDTFLKAIGAGAQFCGLDDPRAWLFRVARNALIDRLRLARPQDPIDKHAETLAAAVPEPTPAVDALTGCIARVLLELSADDADCIRACDLDGMTQKDYAAARRLSLPAAKARLLRARRRLRERMTVACRVRFDPADGRVCCHQGRVDGT
ncbi:sigma-70 family RNA polymerase sigma factor [Rubrivivax sp. JA1029]|uniref:sigma-70 family RNA polymerase sigma factor n=1 Tax=Rubrivivax sp. JA1029 TaxID=2894193 RepID=UPI001E532875|nr:sigma-70 family RNA polymerase sigma factor [Rubrivivax sp. JA1029]MCC9646593.1 sigma-70 family RNA polymerase sigma factor [Rubrivivax sp. JA1029]